MSVLLPHWPVAVCTVTTDLYLSLLPHCDLYTSLLLPIRPVPASTVTILTCTYKAGWLPDITNMINTRIVRKHPADIPVFYCLLTLITVMSSYYLRHDTNSKRQKSCLYSQGFKWSCRSTEPLSFRGCTDMYMLYCFHTDLNLSTVTTLIIFIIISILEPCFPLPRVGLFDKSFSKASSPLRTILRVSRDLFCATTFSLRTSAIQPVLRSTCPNHLILLVRSTTSKSWMPSFVRRESELTSSFALTLQIQRIMARSLRRRRFSVSTFMAQDCCMQKNAPHTPHTWWVHLTSGQKGQVAVGEKGKQLAELAPCTFAACDRSQLAATSCREHVPKVAELWDNFKLFVSYLNLWNFSFINSPSSPKASGAPELRVRAQGSLNATAFLMHPALAATTEDCIRATNSWLTDTTGVLSRFLQHVQINARLHNLCLPHAHT